ncbi:MAG: hybrid sensor histidine kinase/response regulator [Candidatus Methylomirabilia bacterium]
MAATARETTIMVVDDVPANVRLLGGILRAQGYQVQGCHSGPETLAAAAEHPPDLILLDIMMPEMNGYEVCERLKADNTLASIPVIFLSSLSDAPDKVQAFSVGGVDYITKPFQIDEVRARVETHIKIRRLQVELEAKNSSLSESNDRLRELEALRDNLVHMVIHDLRNPLTAISTFAYLLETAERERLSGKGLGYVEHIMKSTENLIELVSSMLDVSKMESGQMELKLADCDLGAIAGEVVSRLEALKGERRMSIALPARPVLVRGDAQLLSRLLQNLVGNALKFVPAETGSIDVALEAGGGRARCTVRDNGPGIPPEHREKVFDKFWQGAARGQGIKYSSGLGLTFCKMVVEAHGGKIGVDSEVGAGSSFWFELPQGGPR